MRRMLVMAVGLALLGAACGSSNGDKSTSADASATTISAGGGTRSTGCGKADPPNPGTERLTVEDDNSDPAVERQVERVVPASYDGTTPQPMIVSLHGLSSNIDQIDLFSGLPAAADKRGYVLLTPQALPATLPMGGTTIDASFWNVLPELSQKVEGVHDDVGFLLDLIDDSLSELCIDPDRVYVAGNSNGAGMAATLACGGDGRLAAIAPVSGINLREHCDDLKPVSVIAFHGDADPLVPYEGGSSVSTELENPSVLDATGSFAGADGCDRDPAVSDPFEDIELRRWPACESGTDVELYTVRGGGHTWPGMLNYVDPAKLAALAGNQKLAEVAGLDIRKIAGNMTVSIEATKLMLDFFDAHSRPA